MLNRVAKQLFICKLKFYYSASFEIFDLSDSPPELSRRFYETVQSQEIVDSADAYFSSGSFNFSETSDEPDAGVRYKQTASFRFPANDPIRAQRIEKFRKVKFMEMDLTDGSKLVMGRNDIHQNRAPEIVTSAGLHMAEVKLQTESIQPVLRVYDENSLLVGYDYKYDFPLS